jgi:hypothetical protein
MPSISEIKIPVTADLTKALVDLHRLVSRIEAVGVKAQKTESDLGRMVKAALGFATVSRSLNALKDSVIKAHDFVIQAEGLNLTTEAFGRLKVASAEVGMTTGELTRLMQRFDVSLGDAQLSADRAQKKFKGFLGLPSPAAQAFHRLGIDAKELAKLPLDKRFEAISKSVLALGSDSDRLAALQSVFRNIGRGDAVRVLALMKQVQDAGEAQHKAKVFGLTVSPGDVEQIKQGRAALADLSLMWDGLKVQLGAAIAPLFRELVGATQEWVEGMGGMEAIVKRVANTLADLVGDAKDFADYIRFSGYAVASTLDKAVAGWARIFDFIGAGKIHPRLQRGLGLMDEDFTNTVEAHTRKLDEIQDRVHRRQMQRMQDQKKATRGMFGDLGPMFDLRRFMGKQSGRLRTDGSSVADPAFRDTNLLNKTDDSLLDQIKRDQQTAGIFGLMARTLDAVNWGSVSDHVRVFAEAVGKIGRTFEDADFIRKLQEQAALMEHELATPAEQLQFMARQLDLLKEKGGLSEGLANLKLFRFFGEMEKATGLQQVQLAPAARFGTSAAGSIISQFEGRRPDNQLQRLEAFARQQEEHQRIIQAILERFAAAWKLTQRRQGDVSP